MWVIYYRIQHCLPTIVEYGWRVKVERTFLLINIFLFFFLFPLSMWHAFVFFPFFFQWARIVFRLDMPFFKFVKEALHPHLSNFIAGLCWSMKFQHTLFVFSTLLEPKLPYMEACLCNTNWSKYYFKLWPIRDYYFH